MSQWHFILHEYFFPLFSRRVQFRIKNWQYQTVTSHNCSVHIQPDTPGHHLQDPNMHTMYNPKLKSGSQRGFEEGKIADIKLQHRTLHL